jgi:UDP-N-acetylmuramoyl-L-alanyl-D-glutamate--2,6-diaminopimelate ligase
LNLSELLKALPGAETEGTVDLEISNLAYDSRKVKEQGLFVAISGNKLDGHRFIEKAVLNGARAVVVEGTDQKPAEGVTLIRVQNSRQALGRLSASFYGQPASRLFLIGITGTSGKTTTSYLIESILKRAGLAVGVIGTINYRYGNQCFPASVTTPESLDLQALLADMVQEKVSHVVMEVSSHALDQGRVGDMEFDQAIFTNLSQDHLDYHLDLETYFQAKSRLFYDHLKDRGLAIINRDDPYGQRLWQEWEGPKQGFAIENQAAYRPLEIRSDLRGLRVSLQTPKGVFNLKSPLIGRYNIYNFLAAWAVGEGLGLDSTIIREGLETLTRVPGRMEAVDNPRGVTVLVDYAHKPEALRFALRSLKESQGGRILTVFGCGGDRDKGKRPIMGQVAGQFSRLTVVTSDNPRSEDPLKIIQEIEAGLKEAGLPYIDQKVLDRIPLSPGYTVISDRREAIAAAVRLAGPGDVVLVAGKGHETYQIVGSKVLSFDDCQEVRRALARDSSEFGVSISE